MSTLHRSDHPLLFFAVSLNAGFSALSGLLMTAMPGTVNTWLGYDYPPQIRETGLMLIGFAVWLGSILYRRRTRFAEILLITGGDFLWVAGSAGLLLINPDVFSSSGAALFALTALVVLAFALMQTRALLHARLAAGAVPATSR